MNHDIDKKNSKALSRHFIHLQNQSPNSNSCNIVLTTIELNMIILLFYS